MMSQPSDHSGKQLQLTWMYDYVLNPKTKPDPENKYQNVVMARYAEYLLSAD
jgi:hypothetical protein